jgi:flavodoxin
MLVIYYSRTGTTQKVAEAIARATGADIEGLVDNVKRTGLLGYLRSGRDAMRQRGAQLKALHVRPANYDLVVVGTPIWGSNLSAPVRAFLEDHRGRLQQVAFFLTSGGKRGQEGVLRDMATAVGQQPVARLAVTQGEVDGDRYASQLRAFLAALPKPPPATRHVKIQVPAESHIAL